ncbi:phosphoenolpyruvate carboxylase, partial [Salmonella enterica subsp. enterica serovar Heidelberg str. SARA37]
MGEINNCLKQLDNTDIADYERHQVMRRLRQLIAQSWHTDEIRKQRPSPVDEAKWGFAVVENSLWQGVPNYLRELNEQLGIREDVGIVEGALAEQSVRVDGQPAAVAEVEHVLVVQVAVERAHLARRRQKLARYAGGGRKCRVLSGQP